MTEQTRERLFPVLVEYICEVTGLPREGLTPETSFDEIGLQSLSVVAFTRRLEAYFPHLPRTFLFDCRNLREVAAYLSRRFPAETQEFLASAPAAKSRPQQALDDLEGPGLEWPDLEPLEAALETAEESSTTSGFAVIGMDGRFPGAQTLSEFWRNLKDGVDSVTEIPRDRWDLDGFFEPSDGRRHPGRSYSKWGAFLTDIDCFDAKFFGIAPREAALMDPQERLFLETSWHAMEDAGLLGERAAYLKGEDGYEIGVFLGLTTNTYSLKGPAHWRKGHPEIPTSMPWSAANRVSYFLDLCGPSLTVDTACSSSLVAIHLACESLERGECRAAIAGGVNLYLHPAKYIQLCQQQMLSPSGRCHSFGVDADGFTPGEGVGVLVLKTLKDALRDRDRILAVVRGTAVNHNGRTNGYTVPKARSQAALLRHALARAGVSPGSISYVEAHGTGTKLGDPIEVSGLSKALGGEDGDGRCALGTVKSNIGHLESAAGVAGVVKTILQLRHDTIAPSLHSASLNPALALEGTRFFVPQEALPWRPSEAGPRRAGISSFGAGGTNAHVIVEDAPMAERAAADFAGPMVFPVSARRRCALDKAARALLSQLESMEGATEKEDLARLAYTLQCARRHFEHRLAFVADGKGPLEAQVKAYVAADSGEGSRKAEDAGVSPYVGFHTQPEAPLEDVRDVDALARAWVRGAAVNWQALWPSEPPRPSEAPKYVFLKERHWLTADPAASLDHSRDKISAVAESIRIPAHSSLFKEHMIGGRPLLPATAAIAHCHALAYAGLGRDGVIELSDLAWLRPIAAPSDGDVAIECTSKGSAERVLIELRDARQPDEVCFKAALRSCPPEEKIPLLSLADARALCTAEADIDECYLRFEQAGMAYGPRFRCLEAAWIRDGAALAKVCQREDSSSAGPATPIDPAMLDGALHTANFLLDAGKGELETPLVPVGAKRVTIMEVPGREVFAYARQKQSSSKREKVFDFWVFSPDGRVLIEIEEFRYRHVASATLRTDRAVESVQYLAPIWVETAAAGPMREPDPAILFDIDTRLFDRIRASAPDVAAVTQLAISASDFKVHDNENIEWDPAHHGDLLRRALASSNRSPRRLVFHIRSADEKDLSGPGRPARGSALEAIEILRAFCQSAASPKLHVLIVVDRRRVGESGIGAALGGLLRSIELELPTVSASVLEIEDGDTERAVVEDMRAAPRGGVIEAKLQAGRRYERRLEIVPQPTLGRDVARAFAADDVFIITGAKGAIGRRLALLLSKKGVRRFVLIGRSAQDGRTAALIRELDRNGARARYWQADCSKRDALERVLSEAREVFGPPTGVLHCAGVLKDGFFVRQSGDDLRDACRAKILGAHWLDLLTVGCPIRWFVLCSALAGTRGNIGQSHYAFANTWIDAFAEGRALKALRGERAGKSIAIAWPHWSLADGMQASPRLLSHLQEAGIHPINESDGERIFLSALASASPVVIPVKGNRDDVERFFGLGRELRERAPVHPMSPPPLPQDSDAEQESIAEALLGVLAHAVGSVTGSDPARMDPDAPMEVYGLDSIMVMELNGLLEKSFPTLSKTAAFEARSLRGMAQLITREHPDEARRLASKEEASEPRARADAEAPPVESKAVSELASRPDERSGDIAIIGLAGRYPGAETLEDFWQALAAGRDLVTPIPKRWKESQFGFGGENQDEGIYAHWGAFLDDFDKFDPLFFGISPRDAERMDPQERLFLETAWHAVEDAGYTPEQLSGRRGKGKRRRVAVVAGVMYGEYQFFGAAAAPGSPVPLTNSSYASVANRVSFCLDLDGPSLAVDSMCSSSLYAIHIASELIKSGGCDVAIAGGVNLSLHHYKYRTLCELGFASSDGKCRSFGDGGDGYVPGEGVGAVVLKPAHLAIRDKDHIYGIIRGSDIGHGGRGSGYTVPNAEAQADVIRGALDRSGIEPVRLSYIEAHGTGTSLGDPIEIRGLSKALSKSFPAGAKCPIGSIKSNIGHLESAAGIAALTKVLLQMKHGKIAPSLHSATLNRNIDFSSTPFFVQTELADWAHDGAPRIAALSSFGAGGSNAHMVVEEYWPPIEPRSTGAGEEVFLFSARSWKQLAAYLDRFIDHLEREAVSDTWLGKLGHSTAEVAATLMHGRRHHRVRCAVVARDFNRLYLELKSCLACLERVPDEGLSHSGVSPSAFLGEVQDGRMKSEAARASLREQAGAWVEGQWTVPEQTAPSLRKVPLPGYVFERNRYWLWDLDAEQEAPRPAAEIVSAPIIINEEITPEAILEKVDRGVLNVADAQALLNRLLAAEAAE